MLDRRNTVNKTKMLIIVILSCLMFFGFITTLMDNGEEERQMYVNAMEQGKAYEEKGLYQLAIKEYKIALSVQDSKELRTKILDVYSQRYKESRTIYEDYVSDAVSAVNAYSSIPEYYSVLANLYIDNGDYKAAYKCLDNAILEGVRSEEIEVLYKKVKYSFVTEWYTYTEILSLTNGLYAVMDDNKWGYVDENGVNKLDREYSLATQVGDEGVRVLISDEVLLVDSDEVIRGKLSFTPKETGIYSEGLIAISDGKSYGYYNSCGEHQFGKYTEASNFSDGKAAVKGKTWMIINSKGENLTKNSYQDIKFNVDGSYLYNNIMLAKVNGKYKLFNQKEEPISTFECDDIDVVTSDGLIAFKSNGKWGFVDTTGKVVIEPKYEEAKSFSNGMAAVCKNNKWGFIDTSGELVVDYQFIDVDYFNSERNCFVKTTVDDWQLICMNIKL